MTTFKEFLSESINDKGIFKAIFIIGIAGAGKSHAIKKLSGSIQPRIVSTDKTSEFLLFKNAELSWSDYGIKSQNLTVSELFNYLNGMLPLFIEGTSNDISNILQRAGILESIGYDVGVVNLEVDLDIAMQRVAERNKKQARQVDIDFVKRAYDKSLRNAEYLKTRVDFFRSINTSKLSTIEAIFDEALVKTGGFFKSPVQNPVGQRALKMLKESGEKYLTPTVVSKEIIIKKLENWYRT